MRQKLQLLNVVINVNSSHNYYFYLFNILNNHILYFWFYNFETFIYLIY